MCIRDSYFINNCNLVDDTFCRLIPVNISSFSSWFVNNYIRRCSQLCPHNVSRLFDDVSTTTKLHNAVSAIVDFRLNTALSDAFNLWLDFYGYNITDFVSCYSLTVWSLIYCSTELRKISTNLPRYFLSLALLHLSLIHISEPTRPY